VNKMAEGTQSRNGPKGRCVHRHCRDGERQTLRSVATSRQLQQKYSFHDLTHERRFIPSEPLERPVVKIGEALETERQFAGGVHDKSARTGRLVARIGFGMGPVTVATTFLAVLVLEWKEFGCDN
jgi:hypothetical protein